jgi:5-methylcytosine-specific restriction protein A
MANQMTARERYHHYYNTKMWRQLREVILAEQPLCQECLKRDVVRSATVVHHLQPHLGNWELFKDPNNLQSVCSPCHDGEIRQVEQHGYSDRIGADGWPVDPAHPANK